MKIFVLLSVLFPTLVFAQNYNIALVTGVAVMPIQLALTVRVSERQTQAHRIQKLIESLNKLENAKFIRNGKEHVVSEAIDHITKKWKWKQDQIKSANEFINIVGTKSSMTGKPYLIKMQSGKIIKLESWFRKELKAISK